MFAGVINEQIVEAKWSALKRSRVMGDYHARF